MLRLGGRGSGWGAVRERGPAGPGRDGSVRGRVGNNRDPKQ